MSGTRILAAAGAALLGCAGGLATSSFAERSNAPEAALELAPAPPPGDPARGQELYETRCIACHSLDESRVGPRHKGLFGRKAGSVTDFDYSPAVRASKIVWGEQTVNAWLTNPEALIPGQKMGYSVPDATDRADIIAYLKKATPE